MGDGLRISVLTLFPELLDRYFETSLVGKAVERGLLIPDVRDIRDHAVDRHRTCDDAPYGGGAGMVLMAEPLAAALDALDGARRYVVFPSPSGIPFSQARAQRLAERDDLVFICGRYEGIDQRIIDEYVDEEVSIGDYVISSGEISTMVIIDAIYRLREGMLRPESTTEESFQEDLLEYPHYTRPEVFRDRAVPSVLLSGNHRRIDEWRRRQRIERTAERRPDLLSAASLSDEERRYADGLTQKENDDGRDKGT